MFPVACIPKTRSLRPPAPTVSSFSINSGATNTDSVTVTLDNTCTNSPTHYMASENSDFSGASWETYSTSPSFTMSYASGTKTIYFKVKNGAGESSSTSDTIDLLLVFQITAGSYSGTISTSGGAVTIYWGDSTSTDYNGTDQAFTHTYSGSSTYTVKIGNASRLTKWITSSNFATSFNWRVVPSSLTYFRCEGSNTLSGTLSLPSSMTYFTCGGSNTLSGTLSLPSSMTSFWCTGSNTLSGTLSMPSSMTYFNCTGSNTLSGTLSLPSGMTSFTCSGSNTLSGTLNFPSSMTYFDCRGSNTLSGTLSMPSSMTYFTCGGSNTLSGTLSLPSGMTSFQCYGSNTLSGTLSLPSGMTYFVCTGGNTLSGYSTSAKASNQTRMYLVPVSPGGMSSSDVDQILIDYAAAGGTWASPKEVYLKGTCAARTSASDSAVATLVSKGVTVTTN